MYKQQKDMDDLESSQEIELQDESKETETSSDRGEQPKHVKVYKKSIIEES